MPLSLHTHISYILICTYLNMKTPLGHCLHSCNSAAKQSGHYVSRSDFFAPGLPSTRYPTRTRQTMSSPSPGPIPGFLTSADHSSFSARAFVHPLALPADLLAPPYWGRGDGLGEQPGRRGAVRASHSLRLPAAGAGSLPLALRPCGTRTATAARAGRFVLHLKR